MCTNPLNLSYETLFCKLLRLISVEKSTNRLQQRNFCLRILQIVGSLVDSCVREKMLSKSDRLRPFRRLTARSCRSRVFSSAVLRSQKPRYVALMRNRIGCSEKWILLIG